MRIYQTRVDEEDCPPPKDDTLQEEIKRLKENKILIEEKLIKPLREEVEELKQRLKDLELKDIGENITLCKSCNCMTRTIKKSFCGKCGKENKKNGNVY